MSIEKYDLYVELVKRKYPDIVIDQSQKSMGNLNLKRGKHIWSICIGDTVTWLTIKKRIEGRNQTSEECSICYERFSMSHVCRVCNNLCCHTCFIDIMEKGQGVYTCPYCRHTVGEKCDNVEMNNRITCILDRLLGTVDKLI